VERTALMSTSIEECIQRAALADEHNLNPCRLDEQRLQLLHSGFVRDRRPILGRLQKGGVIDAGAAAKRQMTAEESRDADGSGRRCSDHPMTIVDDVAVEAESGR
jgi:hypothetical protein